MKLYLNSFVTNEVFSSAALPQKTNKRFYPRGMTIRSHMVESTQKLRYSKISQEYLIDKISEWKRNDSQDKIYFRAKVEKDNSYDDQGMLNKNVLEIYIDYVLLFYIANIGNSKVLTGIYPSSFTNVRFLTKIELLIFFIS